MYKTHLISHPMSHSDSFTSNSLDAIECLFFFFSWTTHFFLSKFSIFCKTFFCYFLEKLKPILTTMNSVVLLILNSFFLFYWRKLIQMRGMWLQTLQLHYPQQNNLSPNFSKRWRSLARSIWTVPELGLQKMPLPLAEHLSVASHKIF